MDNFDIKCKEFIEKNCLDLNSYEYNKLVSKYPILKTNFEERWTKIENSMTHDIIGVKYEIKYYSTISISFEIAKTLNCHDLYLLTVCTDKIFKNNKKTLLGYTFSNLEEKNAFGNFLPGTLSNTIAYMIYPELVSTIKKEKINLDILIEKYIYENNE